MEKSLIPQIGYRMDKIELKEGLVLKVKECWNNVITGKHFVEDIVKILKVEENKVTFHSDYLGGIFTVPKQNFWNGVELLENLT